MTSKLKTRPAVTQTRSSDKGQKSQLLYLQVVQVLKDEIVKGVYPVGSQLPTEEELCTRFSVSRYTVREALRRLREDRLVSSRQGAGTTVTPPTSDSYIHQVTSINDLIAFASDLRLAVDKMETVLADDKLAVKIGCEAGSNWLAVQGYRYAENSDLPICWTEVFINAEFAAVGRLLHRNRGPIFHLIEDLFGQRIAEVHQEISASLVPEPLAEGLKVKAGAIALKVQRLYRLTTGKIAQVAINIHPAERFRHSMSMKRVKT